MSKYYSKYLKYKIKYNKLLSSIGGRPDLLSELKPVLQYSDTCIENMKIVLLKMGKKSGDIITKDEFEIIKTQFKIYQPHASISDIRACIKDYHNMKIDPENFNKLSIRPFKEITGDITLSDTTSIMTTNKVSLRQVINSFVPIIPKKDMDKIIEMLDKEDRTRFFDNFETCRIADNSKCKIYFIERHYKLLIKKLALKKEIIDESGQVTQEDITMVSLDELIEIFDRNFSKFDYPLTTFIINPYIIECINILLKMKIDMSIIKQIIPLYTTENKELIDKIIKYRIIHQISSIKEIQKLILLYTPENKKIIDKCIEKSYHIHYILDFLHVIEQPLIHENEEFIYLCLGKLHTLSSIKRFLHNFDSSFIHENIELINKLVSINFTLDSIKDLLHIKEPSFIHENFELINKILSRGMSIDTLINLLEKFEPSFIYENQKFINKFLHKNVSLNLIKDHLLDIKLLYTPENMEFIDECITRKYTYTLDKIVEFLHDLEPSIMHENNNFIFLCIENLFPLDSIKDFLHNFKPLLPLIRENYELIIELFKGKYSLNDIKNHLYELIILYTPQNKKFIDRCIMNQVYNSSYPLDKIIEFVPILGPLYENNISKIDLFLSLMIPFDEIHIFLKLCNVNSELINRLLPYSMLRLRTVRSVSFNEIIQYFHELEPYYKIPENIKQINLLLDQLTPLKDILISLRT